MKRTIGFIVLGSLMALAGASCIYVPYRQSGPPARVESAYDRADDLDVGYFYNELQPYGLWTSYRPYGYVWIPRDVGYNWRPYTQGRWVWTDYGWTWVSLETWGWIAFHYGRWGWDQRLGWFWVPDVLWGPAWVAWRWGDAHVGWAPLPPGADFIPGRGFARGGRWDIPGNYWIFVRGRDFMDRNLHRWVLPVERNRTVIDMTRFEVNINERDRHIVNDGVDVDWVRGQSGGRTVERFALKDATRPGQAREEGRDLVISRPSIRGNSAARPREIVDESKIQKDFGDGTAGRIYRQPAPREEEKLREDHRKEQTLLKDSQETEITSIRRKGEEEKAKVRSPEEKKKIESRTATRVAELKKKHEQEKAELDKRQKAEEEKTKTKKPPIKRKTEVEKT
jgi:hypothetical protein